MDKPLERTVSHAQRAEPDDDGGTVVASAVTFMVGAQTLRSWPFMLIQNLKILHDGKRAVVCK